MTFWIYRVKRISYLEFIMRKVNEKFKIKIMTILSTVTISPVFWSNLRIITSPLVDGKNVRVIDLNFKSFFFKKNGSIW